METPTGRLAWASPQFFRRLIHSKGRFMAISVSRSVTYPSPRPVCGRGASYHSPCCEPDALPHGMGWAQLRIRTLFGRTDSALPPHRGRPMGAPGPARDSRRGAPGRNVSQGAIDPWTDAHTGRSPPARSSTGEQPRRGALIILSSGGRTPPCFPSGEGPWAHRVPQGIPSGVLPHQAPAWVQ